MAPDVTSESPQNEGLTGEVSASTETSTVRQLPTPNKTVPVFDRPVGSVTAIPESAALKTTPPEAPETRQSKTSNPRNTFQFRAASSSKAAAPPTNSQPRFQFRPTPTNIRTTPVVESQFRFRPELLSPIQSYRSPYSDPSPMDPNDLHGFREYQRLSREGRLEESIPPVPPRHPVPSQGSLLNGTTSTYMPPPEKPEKFGGDKEEDIDEFLTTMNIYLRSIHIPQDSPEEAEKYKVVLLHRHLTGRARIFWQELSPTKKSTYALASSALRQRFPVPNHEIARLDSRNRAIMEMNNLTQGTLMGDEYVEKVQEIYAQLGDEYALSLATRFVDGINDRVVQIQVDGKIEGVYTPFHDVIQAYLACTSSLRRREAAAMIATKRPQLEPETQGYEQVIRQMGEMFKDILSKPSPTSQSYSRMQPTLSQPNISTVTQAPGQVPIPQVTMPVSTGQSYQREFRPRGEMTCFRCGTRGHRASDCMNSPLPREEQERLRNNFTSRYGDATSTSRTPQVVAQVEIAGEDEHTDPTGMMMMSANLVEAFTGDYDDVRQLKERMACLEAAMADRRGREGSGDTTVTDDYTRGRRRGERSASPTRSRSQQLTARIRSPLTGAPANPLIRDPGIANPGGRIPASGGEPRSVENTNQEMAMSEDEIQAPGSQPFIPDPYFADPAVYSQFIPTATAPRTRKKRGPPKPKRHIRMMQGQSEWNPVEVLRNLQVTGLSVAGLLDMAPSARIAMVKALQLEPSPDKQTKAKTRRPPARVVDFVDETEVCAIIGARDRIEGVTCGVLPEPKVRFFNFHTTGEAVLYPTGKETPMNRLEKILIDGGAVVNLMPEEVARNLGLPLTENSDILIRTATNEIRCVKYCTKFDVRIAGVTATITVHVLDIPQSYSLLLGRRWLYQVRAIGDYATHSYTIYDAEGTPHLMSSSPGMKHALMAKPKGPEVLLNPKGGPGLTDQEKNEIRGQEKMQALLARVTLEAQEQMLEYDEDFGDDEDDEDEEGPEDEDSEEDHPKGQRR